MKRTAKWGTFLAILAVLSGTLIIRGTITQVPAGTWAPAGNSTSMASARAGAASVLLQDGRILITGGDPGTGAVSSADLFDISGNFSAAAPMIYPRSQHTATVLADGTVLVTGGQSGVTGGTALATAEIYNPTANTWTPTTGTMVVARSGHTASLLQDSTVLVAGGDNQGTAQSSLEIYNASTGLFSTTVGSLTSPRELHAAAVLQSGQVIIVGGQCAGSAQNCPAGTGALASSDTYDPSSGSVSAGPAMSTPRQNLSATTQLDGKVLVAGGNNGNANGNVDLATAEVYDPTAGTFTLTSSLATARQGHQAFLLPHNAAILVVGGTSTVGGVETASSSVEMYYPLASGTDAPANWNGTFNPTAAMDSFTGGSARTGATGASPSNGTPSSIDDGLLLVAGGKDATGTALSSSELYGFAWVKTDATDYAPGTTVNITGGGWQPGETITLHFQEVPYYDSHPDLTATVQSDGTFSNSQFSPDSHDIGIRFYLYVTGSKSGLQAQTTFTDNNVTVLSAPSGVTYTLTWTGYKTSSNCTGTIQNGPTNVLGITSSNGPGKNLGIGTPTSLDLQAPPLSDQGGAFQNWSWTQTAAVTAVGSSTALTSPTSTHPICAQNPTGTFTATYSATATAPTLSNISVASGDLGTTVASMVLTGTNFVAGSTVSFSGTGITIGTTTVNSSTQITLTNVAISGTASSVGSHNVTVTNPGSGGGSATSGTQTFTVNPRTTSTSVSCSPASVNVGSATTCTATVTDTDSGTKTAPTGTVTLASSGSGSGSGTFSPSSGQCTLSGSTSPTSCSVSYTPSAVGTGTHTITGSYSGDGTHASSNDTETGFSLAVNKATATVTLSNLTQTYTGSALTPTATTSPSGLSITWTGAPDTAAGSYAVTATVNDANYTGSASGTFTINKAAATVTLSNLTQTYAGSALTPTATTSPSGLSITWTGAPDTNAGSYPVTATVNDANYTGSASGTFTINKAAATVTLSNLTQTYTGSALTPTATTSPSGLSITWTGAPDTNAGSYPVTATVNDANYTGSASGTFTINKAAATVTLSNLTQTYTGSALTPTATTSPSGLSITWTGAPDTNAGSYPVTATVNDANYTGSASGTFTINKAAATVTLSNLTQTYTGGALTPTATTSPSGLSITWTGAPDTNAGSYPVTATVNDANYTGSASGTFTINKAAATVTLSNLTQTYTGGALTPTATTSPSGLSITWTGAPDTNAGSYPVTATVNDANYTGSASGTFTINKAAATVTLSNLTQTYTGGALTPTATTSPAGPSITWTGAPDTNIGSYAVTATVNDANYTGSASGTFTINKAAATVTLSNLTQTYTGSALTPTATTSPSGLSITWTGAPDTAAGSYPVTATVNDPNYTGSASGTFTINKASSTTGISASPSSITIGQSTTVTATVNPQHSGTPGGTVSVSDGFTGIGDTCTITLSGGTGTCNLTPTAIGSLTVTGTYNGDSNFAGSSGSAGLSVTGTPAYITSANNTTFTAGAPGSFTVTTSGIPTPAITETGTLPAGVTFTDNGNGTATLATTAAATLAGTFTITINAANIVGADSQSFTLTISPGAFTQLQVLVPGETAVPGDVTDGGKTGRPSTGYVNGQFQVTVNAVDQYWNVVNTVTDTVHFTSTDTNPATQLPADTPLVAGTGKFSVTLETPENPAATTITATDETTTGITDGTSAKLEVIVVYTATISPTMAGTGDAATYMLTVNNFASPNTNNLGSVTVKVPQDGGTPSNVSVTAANGNTQVNWFVDSNPPNQYASGYIAVRECTASDASAPCNGTGSNDVTAGGTISIHFTATATNSISGATAQNIWTTTAYSDAAYASGLPLAPPEPTVTIGQPPAFTSGASTTFTYGAAGTFSVQATGYPTPSLTESGSLPSGVTFTDNKDGTATLAGTPTSAGAFPITITAHNGYGTDATQNFTLTVNKASATITVTPYNVTYDGKAHSATVTSITGVNGETGATVGTVDVSNTTHTNAGTYSSDYWSFTGTANYNNIAATTITDTINKATASISVTPYSVTYDGSAHTATGTATGVGGVNLASDLDLSHTTHTNAGTYSTDYWTFTDNTGNYNNVAATTITDCIKKANATVVVTPYTVTYDGNAHIATVTSITGVNGETGATVGTVTLNTTHTNAGTYASDTWSFTGTANYNNIAATTITDTINKADAKVVVAPYTVAYDGNAHTATVTSITGVNGEMGATVGTVTLNTTHTAAGTYNTDSWSFTGAANYNDIAATTITDTINKANAVVVVKPYTVNYDGQPHTATVTSITGVNGETGATVGTVDVSNTTHTNAGTYASDSWSFTGAANYNNIAATTITDQINQATLKITAASGMMTYGGTVPTVNTGNAIYASFVNGETSSVLGAGFSCSPGVTSSSPVGTYSSICSGAVDSNYNISYVPGTVTVNAAPLTITASSGSMTYGGSPFVVGPVPSGFVNGDGLGSLPTPPVCLPVFTTSTPAGTYISTCTGPPVDGNYSVTYVNGSVMVNQATTSTTVTSSLATSNWGNVVTFTATVSPQYSGVPTGDVNFYNAASSASCAYLGTSTLLDQNEPLSATGQATTSNAWLPPGTDNVLACYIGDPNFLMSTGTGSSSTPFAQTVIAAPLATLTPPGGLTFGNQQGGTTSSAQTLTLQNAFNGFNGTAPLLLSIGLTGNNSTWFTESDNCGSSLAAGASCTITLKFAPPLNGTGVASASLNVTDDNENVSGSTQSSSLIGSGLTVITDQSLYTNAIFATAATCGSITLSGGSTVDSFNSAQGYPASDAKAGNVGTNGNLTLNGSKSAVDGTAYLPSTVTGNCSQSSVTGLTTSGGAQVTGGEKQLSGPITYPAPPAPSPAPPTTTQNISGSCPSSISSGLCSNGPGSKAVTLTPGTYGNVTASGGTTVYVSKGTYNTNSLTLSGKSTLYANSGPVVVNLAGASLSGAAQVLDLSGGSIQNPTAIPANLQFTYAGSRGVNLSGGSGSYATVYAPNALVSITGGSDFFGSIIGSTITASGGTAIHYDSNLPNIPAGDYLWFNAVVNNVNLNKTTSQVKLYMTNASVQYTASGTSCTMATPCTSSVPNAVVTFNSSALKSGATTIYDMTNNRWATAVSSSGLTGNTFLAGVAVPVPMGGFPNGIQNVQFSAAFSTDTPGVSLQWQWGAAVYSSFSTTYATSSNKNVLGVNPEDGSANSNPPDPAGTPETYKQYINFGGTGGGLASYTGYLSTKAGLIPTIAPISVSPSSLDFSNGGTVLQTVGTQSSPMTATLTNNDSVAYTINTNGISIGGTNATDFSQTNNCPVGGSFAAGASCNINVTFTPTATGARTAKVVINDLAANSPQTVYLSGTGQ